MALFKTSVAIMFSLSLIGCSPVYFGVNDQGPTLASLEHKEHTNTPAPLPKTELSAIENAYKNALEITQDPALKHKIAVRLADIEMAKSQNTQLNSPENTASFSQSITQYEQLLRNLPAEPNPALEERLLYQLAKAYALEGRMEESTATLEQLITRFPQSLYTAEAQFRRAEQAFNAKRYASAQQAYLDVANKGANTPFYLNALYMQGWAEFKLNQTPAAIKTFTQLLDTLLPANTPPSSLSGGKKNLTEDTLRVLAYSFAALNGASSITQTYSQATAKPYQPLIYNQLAQYHLEKKRYKDAADTYAHFIQQAPNAPEGPSYFVQMIDVYLQGGFPTEILPAKESYVALYGLNTPFWNQATPSQQETIKPTLKTYLDELSSHYHAMAQNLSKTRPPKELPAPVYLKAAGYYQAYLNTFPNAPEAAHLTFLMAEAYNDAQSPSQAINAYEQVAYTLKDPAQGANAGFAALGVLQKQIAQTQGEEQKRWQAHKNTSAQRFASTYPMDARALTGLASAAEDYFQQGNTAAALPLAQQITQWQPTPPAPLLKTAWLVIAHTQFDLKNYPDAEQAFRKSLALMAADDAKRASISEHIAACMYKKAETQSAQNNSTAAIEEMLAINAVAPGTDIAIKGQYDAGNQLMTLKNWARAEQVFTDFSQRYPKHALTPSVAPKLAVIYQELKQWDKAANALATMSQQDANPEARRTALFLSAELSRKAGNSRLAVQRYTDYLKAYPQPFDVATEARFQLFELNQQLGDSKAANQWQQALIDADTQAGPNRTERSKFLAASASQKLADEHLLRFKAIRLTPPLKDSIKQKRAAMDAALASYKKVIDFGQPELTTAANHHIGEIYADLFTELKASQPPSGLDELAQEQYSLMLDEQAAPFKTKAISLLIANTERAPQGLYDEWVQKSYAALAKLQPARFNKKERISEVANGLE